MFAVLHVADFALHAVLRLEPGMALRPAALFAATSKKSVVLAANFSARAHHVEPGMTAPQAVARCPALVIRTPKPDAETEARGALIAIGFTLSPALEDTAPGVCTIDLRGLDATRRAPLARAAVEELRRAGLPATAGIADTPLLALYAARHLSNATFSASGLSGSPRLDARESSDGSVHVIATSKDFLSSQPLATADPPPELAAIFHSWGLRTLGDLTALARDDIVRRFGAEGLALWQRASGGEIRPLRRTYPAEHFAASAEFEEPIETLEPLLFVLRRLLDRLSLELRASQHVAVELQLQLRLEDDASHTRSFRLPEPTAEVEILFRALHTHLESLQTDASIGALHLSLTPARPLVRQQGLFDAGLRDPHGFAETLARVAALVGADRAGTPRLEDTHRPDAVKLVTPATTLPDLIAPPIHPALGLPLRRFRPPLPAQIEFTGDRPTFLWTDQVHGEIVAHSDAWHSSGDWWQSDRAWSRTEWDIRLGNDGLYRLVRLGDAYFLEGEYD